MTDIGRPEVTLQGINALAGWSHCRLTAKDLSAKTKHVTAECLAEGFSLCFLGGRQIGKKFIQANLKNRCVFSIGDMFKYVRVVFNWVPEIPRQSLNFTRPTMMPLTSLHRCSAPLKQARNTVFPLALHRSGVETVWGGPPQSPQMFGSYLKIWWMFHLLFYDFDCHWKGCGVSHFERECFSSKRSVIKKRQAACWSQILPSHSFQPEFILWMVYSFVHDSWWTQTRYSNKTVLMNGFVQEIVRKPELLQRNDVYRCSPLYDCRYALYSFQPCMLKNCVPSPYASEPPKQFPVHSLDEKWSSQPNNLPSIAGDMSCIYLYLHYLPGILMTVKPESDLFHIIDVFFSIYVRIQSYAGY